MISRILVPMDDSEMAQRALRYALENHSDADITVLHVVGGPSLMGGEATGLALDDDPKAPRRNARRRCSLRPGNSPPSTTSSSTPKWRSGTRHGRS